VLNAGVEHGKLTATVMLHGKKKYASPQHGGIWGGGSRDIAPLISE